MTKRIAILGLGSMGGAIHRGLIAALGEQDPPVMVTTNSAASAAKAAELPHTSAAAVSENPEANREAASGADTVILAVKPWMIHDLIGEISDVLRPGTAVISVAAGVTVESMQRLLPEGVIALRAMPNTPSHIGAGVTGVAAAESFEGGQLPEPVEAALADAEAIFARVGAVVTVPESQIDALSAVSGSGPAYLFWFVEEFIAAADRLGFDRETAKVLAQNTVVGAAKLLESTGEDAAALRRKVTSPNGTTEQAVTRLQAGGIPELFDTALGAAITRARELAAG